MIVSSSDEDDGIQNDADNESDSSGHRSSSNIVMHNLEECVSLSFAMYSKNKIILRFFQIQIII